MRQPASIRAARGMTLMGKTAHVHMSRTRAAKVIGILSA